MASNKKGVGRPKIVWGEREYKRIETLASIFCTQEEMAGVMEVDEDTLNRLIKERYKVNNFSEWYKKASAGGKASLRRNQYKLAERNPTMAIWLGKQYLGQRDIKEVEATESFKVQIINDLEEQEEQE